MNNMPHAAVALSCLMSDTVKRASEGGPKTSLKVARSKVSCSVVLTVLTVSKVSLSLTVCSDLP